MNSRARPKVLLGYSTSNETREIFEQHGCDTWTADIRPGEGPKHIQGDIWAALSAQSWDFAVLHPPCTYLTVSGAWSFTDGPYHIPIGPGVLVGAARRAARDEALRTFQRLLHLPFPVVVENPARSFVSTSIRKPDQTLQPYMFGEDASKLTGLWVSKAPLVQVPPKSEWVPPRIHAGRPRWGNQTSGGQCKLPKGENRALLRSAEVRCIIQGAAPQWARWLTSTGGRHV